MRNPDSPLATALRNQGFVPLKRLWVHKDVLPQIDELTERFREDVNRIRAEVGTCDPKTDPCLSKDAAWEAYDRDHIG